MSAYFEAGFSVREPMWHGLGNVLDEYPGREEAIVLAGHDFEVVEIDLARLGDPIPVDEPDLPEDYVVFGSEYRHAAATPGWKALQYRGARGAEDPLDGNLLHVARADYGVIQNSVGWDIAEAMLGEENVRYETAITLKGGAVCSILAWLDEPATIPGDDSTILPWLNLSWAHDGSASLSARPTSIRTVCWNTQSAAEAEGKRLDREYTFRHTKNVMERVEEAKLAISGVRDSHEEFLAIARELGEIKVSKKQRKLFVDVLVPMPPEALISDRVKTNVETARENVLGLFEGEHKTIPEAHLLTGYGLQLAGTEYLDHLRGYRSKETYFGRSMLRREPAKAKITGVIREVAKA